MRSLFRVGASIFGIIVASATASLGSSPEAAAISSRAFATESPRAIPAACCKICTQGKACGNTCIARYKDCHQPPGCACDG